MIDRRQAVTGPRKILYVHFPTDMYGASRSLIRLLTGLPRDKYTPTVLLKRDGPLRAALESAGVPVILDSSLLAIERTHFRGFLWLGLPFEFVLSLWRMTRLISKQGYSLVHTNTSVILTSGLSARLAGAIHVCHVREWYGEFGVLWKLYSRLILMSSDAVVCVSGAVAAQFPENHVLHVVNNGFDILDFPPLPASEVVRFRLQFGLRKVFTIGTVGRIKAGRKGQDVFVKAAEEFLRGGHDAVFLIVGAPYRGNETEMESLLQLISELGIEKSVIFTGEMDDPRVAYAAMDVFVLPSAQPEPFGGVVIEAMAMSKPVVATKIGGSVEQVVDGETGYLIPPDDHHALAEKLDLLFRHPDLCNHLGSKGRRRVEEHFPLSRLSGLVYRIYEDLLRCKDKS
jgi:glycosyltransferase involved in cell wall biosynthesis